MNAKISVFVISVEAVKYICYHCMLKFAKLLLATSVSPERSISRMTFIKSFLRKITTGNRLNLISTPSTSQKLQPGNNPARLWVAGDFRKKSNFYYGKCNNSKYSHVAVSLYDMAKVFSWLCYFVQMII